MRISDWSSDVCSSDLAPLQLRLGSKLPSLHILSLKRREQNLSRQRRIPEPAPHPQRLPRLRDVVDAQQLRALFRRPIMERDAEIGRASCRERVCQYVKISVVAVSLKKKK